MNEIYKNIVSDKIFFYSLLTTFLSIIIAVAYVMFNYSSLPPFVPIYNQMPWGEAQLGKKQEIFIPILISSVISIFNLLFAIIIYKKMPITARILSSTSLLICFFTLIVIVRTIRLII